MAGQRSDRAKGADSNSGSHVVQDDLQALTHWTESITTNQFCASCGATREGNFCRECGQRHFQERLRFWELLKELISKLTDLERGLFHTFIEMFRRPGQVSRDYVAGRQKPYVNPLTYFFIGAASQILAFWSVLPLFREQFTTQLAPMRPAGDAGEKFEELMGQPFVDVLVDSYISGIMQGYSYAALFFFVVPFAVLLWLFHGGLGEKFQLGESVVFSLFTYGQMLILTAAVVPFTLRMGQNVHLVAAVIVYLSVPQIAHTHFFQRTWVSRLITVLATGISWASLLVGINLIFILSVASKVAFALLKQS